MTTTTKPEPAPEPQGSDARWRAEQDACEAERASEEPPPLTTPATPGGPAIDWKRADKWAIEYEDDWAPGATPNAARAYLALRAENEKLKAHALVFPADLITERDALRAELAQVREERDCILVECSEQWESGGEIPRWMVNEGLLIRARKELSNNEKD